MHCSDVGSLIERNPNRIERELRKQKRRDVRNYLHSIAIDASWLDEVVDLYASAGCASWPVLANRRNGAWYREAFDGACYFKSSDGHSGQWAFSRTRLNLHVAEAAAAAGGCLVVDSTRRGKRFPDAFTATVPIWCAVVNRLVARCRGSDAPAAWRDVHLPPWLSASESAQVRARLDGWERELAHALAADGDGGADGARALVARCESLFAALQVAEPAAEPAARAREAAPAALSLPASDGVAAEAPGEGPS